MNRAAYRREARSAAHAMRTLGCTCAPTITLIDPTLWPPGVTMGHYVLHSAGCTLGDEVLTLNRQSIVPAMLHSERRCER